MFDPQSEADGRQPTTDCQGSNLRPLVEGWLQAKSDIKTGWKNFMAMECMLLKLSKRRVDQRQRYNRQALERELSEYTSGIGGESYSREEASNLVVDCKGKDVTASCYKHVLLTVQHVGFRRIAHSTYARVPKRLTRGSIVSCETALHIAAEQ
jgi:hypothetical protein